MLGGFFEDTLKPVRDVMTSIIEFLLAHKSEVLGAINGAMMAVGALGVAIGVATGGVVPIIGAIVAGIVGLIGVLGTLKQSHSDTAAVAKDHWDAEDDRAERAKDKVLAHNLALKDEETVQGEVKKAIDEYNKSISDTGKLLTAGLITSTDAHSKDLKATQKAAETLAELGQTGTSAYKKIDASLKLLSDDNSSASQVAIEWSTKIAEADEKSLTEQKTNAISAAEQKKESLADVLQTAQNYDDLELSAYEQQLQSQEDKDLDDATKKNASAETIAKIKQYYEDQVTDYISKQSDARTKLEETYSAKIQAETDKRESYESDWSTKVKEIGESALQVKLDNISKEERSEEDKATKLGASAATIKDIQTYYNDMATDARAASTVKIEDLDNEWSSKVNQLSESTLQVRLDSIQAQEDAQIDKATQEGASDETIAKMHIYYEALKRGATEEEAKKEAAAVKAYQDTTRR